MSYTLPDIRSSDDLSNATAPSKSCSTTSASELNGDDYVEALMNADCEAGHCVVPPRKMPAPDDDVNSPAHYRFSSVECVDAMFEVFGLDEVKIFAKVTAFKYLWRHRHKGQQGTDIGKASWWLKVADGIDPRTGEVLKRD